MKRVPAMMAVGGALISLASILAGGQIFRWELAITDLAVIVWVMLADWWRRQAATWEQLAQAWKGHTEFWRSRVPRR